MEPAKYENKLLTAAPRNSSCPGQLPHKKYRKNGMHLLLGCSVAYLFHFLAFGLLLYYHEAQKGMYFFTRGH